IPTRKVTSYPCATCPEHETHRAINSGVGLDCELKPRFEWMANDIAPGGQLTTTTDVENLHGFPEGILGIDIIDKFRKQSERFVTKIFTEKVTKVDFSSRPLKLFTDSRTVLADAPTPSSSPPELLRNG
ncbi:unnamed protein product, partial [Brassica oleracea]